MTLQEKLIRLKKNEREKTELDWTVYKKEWVKSIDELQHTIMFNWFEEYEKEKLMIFNLISSKRIEPYLGEYFTTSLEITLANNKTLLLEPIAGVTTEYNGKLEFSMLGNAYKNVNILRQLKDNDKDEWILATSYESKEHRKFTKEELEKLIDLWIS